MEPTALAAVDAGQVLLLVVGGAAAGAINALAGGGSLLSLALLVLAGLSPQVANGSNRLAILAGGLASAWRFHRGGRLPWRLVWKVAPATLLGTVTGAMLATRLPPGHFRWVLGACLAGMGLFVLLTPGRWLALPDRGLPKVKPPMHLAFFGVGLWAGFIQAGFGFLALLALVPGLGLDLVRSNGVKVALNLLLTLAALPVFGAAGQLALGPGLLLAVGMAGGGYLGAHLGVTRGVAWIRSVVAASALGGGLYILWASR
ncbi:MAG: sulfite exporter TauE/SafE family protein [Deltaproteobacteria bacterium]|nr:MAG: sulfite exporter TauE/SafE family protein [Deltaproteobacteria bacterium]